MTELPGPGSRHGGTAYSKSAGERPQRGPCRERLLLLLIFILALGLRGVHWWGQWQANPLFLTPTIVDEQINHVWAQQIATGQGLGSRAFFRAPLYFSAMAGLYRIFGPNVPLARFLGCLLGAATCLLIALLGRALVGSTAGLIAGVLAAIYWPFIHFDQALLSAGLETFLGVLLLLMLLMAVRRGLWWQYVVTGLVWGLSMITRPTAMTFAPVIALWTWFGVQLMQSEGNSVVPWSIRLRNLAYIVVAAGTMVVPVTLYNRYFGGEWVLVATNGGVNFYIGNNASADGVSAAVPGTRSNWEGSDKDTYALAQRELAPRYGRPPRPGEVSDYWYRMAWEWIQTDPGGACRLSLRKLARFWTPVEIANNSSAWFFARQSPLASVYRVGFPVVAVLGVAGLVLLPRFTWRVWCLPAAFFLTGMFTVVAFFVVDRYRLPIIPVLMLTSAAGLARLPEVWSQRNLRRLTAYAATILVMIGVQATCRPGGIFWPEGGFYRAQEEASGQLALGNYYEQLAGKQPEMWTQALAHYQAAATAMPLLSSAQLQLGLAMLRSGVPVLTEKAGAPLEKAVWLRPNSADARRFYAHWLFLRARRKEAIEQYRKVVELQPWGEAYQQALLGTGVALLQERRYAEAEGWLVRAVQNEPRDPLTITTIIDAAHWLQQDRLFPEAVALLNRGISSAHYSRELLVALKEAYTLSGNTTKAMEVDLRLTGE